MELDKKRFSIRWHITLVLTLLTVLIVLLIGVCVAVVREQSRTRLTSAADSYLSLLTRTLENQLVIQESYITSQPTKPATLPIQLRMKSLWALGTL